MKVCLAQGLALGMCSVCSCHHSDYVTTCTVDGLLPSIPN